MLKQTLRSFVHSKSIKTRPICRGLSSSHKHKLDIKDIPESEIYWEIAPENGAYDKITINPFAALLTNIAILGAFSSAYSFFKTYWPLGFFNVVPDIPDIDYELEGKADKKDNWKRKSREKHDGEEHEEHGEHHGHH